MAVSGPRAGSLPVLIIWCRTSSMLYTTKRAQSFSLLFKATLDAHRKGKGRVGRGETVNNVPSILNTPLLIQINKTQ